MAQWDSLVLRPRFSKPASESAVNSQIMSLLNFSTEHALLKAESRKQTL